MKERCSIWIRVCLVLFTCLGPLVLAPAVMAQEPPEEPATDPDNPGATTEAVDELSEEAKRLATLAGILESEAAIAAEIEELEAAFQEAETDEQKAAVSEQIEELLTRGNNLENDFNMLASGIDPSTFFEQEAEQLDWKQELEGIFAPVIAELKEASAYPREIEALRAELTGYERRLPQVEEAVSSLQQVTEINQDEKVAERLAELSEFWTQQRDELASRREAADQRLAEKEGEKVTFGQATGNILRLFFKKRFINLLVALLAFAGIFLLLRFLHRLAHKLIPDEVSHRRQLAIRFADIAYYVFTVVVAIGALLVVLYMSADWVLLTIAVFVLIGVAWAARTAVPLFLEQARLLLNVGAVREGERLIYNGIPWKITSLSLYSELVNPELRGGTLRLPLKDLVEMRSREAEDDEAWFPSRIKDWVILSDGIYGEIVEQTPEVVIVATVRGSYQHYPTIEYLNHHPRNLSSNFFAVNHIVGLDYRYRDIVNTEIVSKLKQGLEEGFRKEFYGEHLAVVIVEFKEMSASSLDIITIAKFRGGAASEYTEIRWKLQQLALEVCNENGWEIPFPQLVVTSANGGEAQPLLTGGPAPSRPSL
ncbi:MAG: hypothetical protein AAF560_28790 [Acidobacteriota bacterium]